MARSNIWGNNKTKGYLRQNRNAKGQFAPGKLGKNWHRKLRRRGGGFVPYRRHGLGHNTVGVNAGARVSKNRRISAGFYIRTTTDSNEKRAKKIAKAQEHAQLAIASKMPNTPGGPTTLGGKLLKVKRMQSTALYKTVAHERKTKNGYARIGTDRNALPTIVVRYNSPTRSRQSKRSKAMARYNTYNVMGKRTYDWNQKPKKGRPQRRKKNGKG